MALQVLLQVLEQRRSLSAVLPAALEALPDPVDRAFAQTLCFGVLRHYFSLQAVLRELLERPAAKLDSRVRVAALLGLHQLAHLDTPPHAAVNETVALLDRRRSARGLVNAVLRRFARERGEIAQRIREQEPARLEHPPWLIAALRRAWPRDAAKIMTAGNAHPPLAIRVHLGRIRREDFQARLASEGLRGRPIPFTAGGLIVTPPRPARALPGFADAHFTVQDGAAQLAAPLLDLRPGHRVLDAGAAPGGKTTHILEVEPGLARLVALDRDRSRVTRLRENLARHGGTAEVVSADLTELAEWWNGRQFDRILLDAPCSGSGVIRRHPDIKLLRRASDISHLVREQQAMLEAAWRTLARGGLLLYATCSVLPEENEDQVSRFLGRHEDAQWVSLAPEWGRPAGAGRQILPGGWDMDGFFYALVRKRAAG